jgi:hypothetical protein
MLRIEDLYMSNFHLVILFKKNKDKQGKKLVRVRE